MRSTIRIAIRHLLKKRSFLAFLKVSPIDIAEFLSVRIAEFASSGRLT